MKKLLITLSAILLLTGCASSASIEEQAKLIEYEACLTKQEVIQQELRETLFERSTDLNFKLRGFLDSGKPDGNTGLITSLESMIKDCAQYRP